MITAKKRARKEANIEPGVVHRQDNGNSKKGAAVEAGKIVKI